MQHEQLVNMIFFVVNCKDGLKRGELLTIVYDDPPVTMNLVCKWFEWLRNWCDSLMIMRQRDVHHPRKPKTMLKEPGTIRDIWESERLFMIRAKHFRNRLEHEANEYEICSTCSQGRTKATAFVHFIRVAWSFDPIAHFHENSSREIKLEWSYVRLWSSYQGSEFQQQDDIFPLVEL